MSLPGSAFPPGTWLLCEAGVWLSSFPRSSQCPTPLGKLKPRLVKKPQERETPDLGVLDPCQFACCVWGVLVLAVVPNCDPESITMEH